MGLLNLFSRANTTLQPLPSGTLTVDRNGHILASTVSSRCSHELLKDVGRQVVRLFRQAHAAQIPLNELQLHFASFQLTARELRGGAIIFLHPKHAFSVSPPNSL